MENKGKEEGWKKKGYMKEGEKEKKESIGRK